MQKRETTGLMLIRDNDLTYLVFVERVVKKFDPDAKIIARRQLKGVLFHIEPSCPMLKQPILKGILRSHTSLRIRIDLAKTINTSPFINFSTNIEEEEEKEDKNDQVDENEHEV